MAGFYVNTREHYERRHQIITRAILRRAYYEGYPYSSNDLARYDRETWVDIMAPNEDEGDYPIYLDNIAKQLIKNTVQDILPAESKLSIPGAEDLDETVRSEFYRRLFNFGPGYKHTPAGFLSWGNRDLIDCAQTGDGLIFLRLMPGSSPWVQWNFYPLEAWTAEELALESDPLFYRIEYKYDRMEPDRIATYFHRLDIYRDHLVRYHDKLSPWQSHDSNNTPRTILPAYDQLSSYVAPDMEVASISPAAEQIERSIMAGLSDWICVPLIWDREDPNSLRGISALSRNCLQAIDQTNRLLTGWGDAAYQHGNPDLVAIDLNGSGEEGGEDGEMTKQDVSKADIQQWISVGNTPGKFQYPDNLPNQLLHKDPMETIRQAAFEGSPTLGLDPTKIGRFGELSGFASGQLNKSHEACVSQQRQDLVYGGLFQALRIAMELLKAVGGLPEGIDPSTPVEMKVSGRNYSPDEEQKMATVFSSLQDRGLPPKVLAMYAQRFIDIGDEGEFIKSLEEYEEKRETLLEISQQDKQAKPTPAKEEGGDSDLPTDNKLK